jgi:hypothetical protein
MPKPYNGHHCWNCWNVALWIGNEEPLYRAAMECIQRPRASGANRPVTPKLAAHRFLRDVVGEGAKTPDGAKYTLKAIEHTMAGFMEG